MNLRPYQTDCLESIKSGFASSKSLLAVLATGCGKTVIFAHLAHDWTEGRVLVIAHREELIAQAAQKIRAITGDVPGVEMGSERVSDTCMDKPKVVVSSVQTMCRDNRQKQFQPVEFGLLIIDEAHHAVAGTYRKVIDYFGQNDQLKVLGVTATPKRADELAMGQIFEACAFDYGIEPAIEDGWLVPVHQRVVRVEGLDFSRVKSTAGDLNEGDLEAILIEEEKLHKVAAPTIELAGDQPTLVFCVTVRHAEMLADVLNRYKPHSAAALSGASDRTLRRQTVDRFRGGDLQLLCNCGLFLEGFDAPNTAVVVMARPTKSLTLYSQVLGRGTRPLPGVVDGIESAEDRRAAIHDSKKPHMIVLDFVGNSGRHKIVTAADVLGGKYGEPVRAYAKKTMEEEARPANIEEAMERASAELDLENEERERRRRIIARASYRADDVSPFVGGRAIQPAAPIGDPATEKQVRFLIRLGMSADHAKRLSKNQARGAIGRLLEAQEAK